jgi:hypothetical protein
LASHGYAFLCSSYSWNCFPLFFFLFFNLFFIFIF